MQRIQEIMWVLMITVCMTMFQSTLAVGESFEVEYYSNVSLPCNYTKHNAGYPGIPIPFKRYWTLPNATVIADSFIATPRMYIDRPTLYDFNLVILDVDDDDFGVYHCVMLWNNINYKMTTIEIGLNEDGPLYEKKLKEFERNVLIGGGIAGGVALILLLSCVAFFYWQRSKRNNKDRSFDDAITYQAPNDYSTKYGYPSREARKDPNVSTSPTTEIGRNTETDTEVYAKVDKSRISSFKASSDQSSSPDVGPEQSVHL